MHLWHHAASPACATRACTHPGLQGCTQPGCTGTSFPAFELLLQLDLESIDPNDCVTDYSEPAFLRGPVAGCASKWAPTSGVG